MGSIYLSKNFEACDEKTLKTKFDRYIEDQCHESGHDTYSANWGSNHGLRVLPTSFSNEQEAEKYIQEKQSKYDPVWAARVGDFNQKFPQTATDKKLLEDHARVAQEVEGFHEDVFKRALAGKTTKRGCSHCGSAIALKAMPIRLGSQSAKSIPVSIGGYSCFRLITDCPVCLKNLLVTATDEKRLQSLIVKRDSLAKKLSEARSAYDAKMMESKSKPYWYLGGWTAY